LILVCVDFRRSDDQKTSTGVGVDGRHNRPKEGRDLAPYGSVENQLVALVALLASALAAREDQLARITGW
jgi:hypothetical protein